MTSPQTPHEPLAGRMRPKNLSEVVGQEAITGPGSFLLRSLEMGKLPSLIFWGPPGTGKTTIAKLVAEKASAEFEGISAVNAGVKELRAVATRAEERLQQGKRTVLFIDEIHRFNKSQQDTILPHVESGLITLLGATTENPSFEVNAALLSRARVVPLKELSESALSLLLDRALADRERGLGTQSIKLEAKAREELIRLSGGDARILLDALEVASVIAPLEKDGEKIITVASIREALQRPALRFDKAGDKHYWQISALIKSVRGSDPDAAIYWLCRLLEAGEEVNFVARRLIILAAEDIGLADPHALTLAVAAQQAAHHLGLPEALYPLSEATIYLSLAPKSNSVKVAYQQAREDVESTLHLQVPPHLRNASTSLGKSLGFGKNYQYPHDYEGGIIAQEYLPSPLKGHQYYHPTTEGREASLKTRLEALRSHFGKDEKPKNN